MSEGFRSEYPDEVEQTERALTREEVLAALSRHAEKHSIQRELSDADGVYLLEVTVSGEKPGEVTEYRYQRKGTFGKNQTTTTHIAVVYYEDEMPVGGKTLENYDEKTGQWK